MKGLFYIDGNLEWLDSESERAQEVDMSVCGECGRPIIYWSDELDEYIRRMEAKGEAPLDMPINICADCAMDILD